MANYESIISPRNRQLKEIASLYTRKGRIKHGSFPVEGTRAISEAIKAGAYFIRVIVEEKRITDSDIEPVLNELSADNVPIITTSHELMKSLSIMETPQGIVAEVKMPELKTIEELDFKGTSLAACDIRDPRNMGLLLRTAEAAGTDNLILAKGSVDPFHPTAVQTSMGAIFHLRFFTSNSIDSVLDAAKEAGIQSVATTVENGTPIEEWLENTPDDYVLIMGNEGAGLPDRVVEKADVAITIPIFGNTESLNVAISAGVVLYMQKISKNIQP